MKMKTLKIRTNGLKIDSSLRINIEVWGKKTIKKNRNYNEFGCFLVN